MSILKVIISSLLWVLLLACVTTSLSAQTPPRWEHQIKAVFLFNFTQFIEWPASAYPAENAPIVIGVLGEDPFGAYLDAVVAGEEVNAHPLVVQRFSNVDEIDTCHILFINITDKDQREQALNELQGRSILTVGDEDNFMQQGGMIRFITVNKKVRFQINPEAAVASGLTISSKLLSLAQIVTLPKSN